MNFVKIKAIAAISTTFFMALSWNQPAQAQNFSRRVLVDGLNSPRGIVVGPDEKLYISEAGRGGNGACIPSPSVQGEELCYGESGAISVLETDTGNLDRLITDLPSLALPNGEDAQGIHDLYFDDNGDLWGVIGLAGDPNVREDILNVPEFGNTINVDLTGNLSWSTVADITAFERDNNPDNGELVSNPYSLVIQGNTTYVIDAGGNSLLEVNSNNQVDLATVFPVREVPNPSNDPNIPDPFPMQSVPTGMAIGPDDAIYIAQYTGYPFPPGGANIYRWNGANTTVFESGFTNLIDLAFAPDGNLYALEYATNVLAGDFTGNLWQVAPDGSKRRINVDGLVSPTGLAISDDGSLYIANNSFQAGQGEIIELSPAGGNAVPEPSLLLGLPIIGYALTKRSSTKKN